MPERRFKPGDRFIWDLGNKGTGLHPGGLVEVIDVQPRLGLGDSWPTDYKVVYVDPQPGQYWNHFFLPVEGHRGKYIDCPPPSIKVEVETTVVVKTPVDFGPEGSKIIRAVADRLAGFTNLHWNTLRIILDAFNVFPKGMSNDERHAAISLAVKSLRNGEA